jgi:hypothetical protein
VGVVGLRLFFGAGSSFMSVAILHRQPRGRMLSEIAGLRALGVAISAVLAATGAPLTPLLVLVGLDALISAQYRPAQSTLIPALARNPKELVASAAGLSTVKTLSQAFGSVIGGVILVWTTPGWCLPARPSCSPARPPGPTGSETPYNGASAAPRLPA